MVTFTVPTKPVKIYAHLVSQTDCFDVTATAQTYSHINKSTLDSYSNSLKIFHHNCKMHIILEVHHTQSSANLIRAFKCPSSHQLTQAEAALEFQADTGPSGETIQDTGLVICSSYSSCVWFSQD
jgi:hypothetical protein